MESSRVDSNLVFLVELETPTAQHKVVNCSVTYVYIHIFIYSFICLYIYIYMHNFHMSFMLAPSARCANHQ